MTHETPFFRREDVFTLTESPTALQLPLFAEAVPAGFPSPAGDYMGFYAGTAEISGQVISQKAVLSVYTFFPYSQ
ncbi:hypothetical protein [Klebsiella pneumoniae]|uniref:hypothetical protein n=1 Tax=Klebsiella pneumoniae TaxID=573 RepID=UPI000D6F1D16|nr:hypothetical protein [Klebsiella pneumoniae]